MSVEHLDWDKLRVFSVVAELRSLTSAAKRLGESTPTVSRKIDDLERKLNCELLVRTHRGVELTEAGRLVEAHVLAITDKANSIWNDVCALDIEGTGRIRMAASDGIASHWLTRSIPDFLETNRGIELELNITDDEVNLLSGDADMTISFDEPRHRDLLSIRLGVLHYMFFASPDYLERHGEPSSLFDLQGHTCLLHSAYENQIDEWTSRAYDLKKALTYSVTTNSGTVLREVCAEGGGIALMPSYVADIDSRLVPLALQEIAPIRFWLVYTQRLQRLSRGRIVIDWVRKQFSQDNYPWFMETFVHPSKRGVDEKASQKKQKTG
ncbi:LysR family transcriptional regulator [Henriciella sp.]|uniref:LysR family transcriptional regulator n=1 Tax=Henriciella sp. TaxID=1968823 RepID=UPI002611EA59|nr:LysR family transcriptional regulator [Henriciella sp.]